MFGRKPRWNYHLSPIERECATLDNVSDEITHELLLPDQSSTTDEPHTFTPSYEFDLDNAPSALLSSIQPTCSTQASTSSKTANTIVQFGTTTERDPDQDSHHELSSTSTTPSLTPPPKSP